MSQKRNSGGRGKKKKCNRGQNCPYKNEYQHSLEFYHDGDNDDNNGETCFIPFSGKGNVATANSSTSARFRNINSTWTQSSTHRIKRKNVQRSQQINSSHNSSQISNGASLHRNKRSNTRDSRQIEIPSNDVNSNTLRFTKANSIKTTLGRKNQNKNYPYINLVDCESDTTNGLSKSASFVDINCASRKIRSKRKVDVVDVEGEIVEKGKIIKTKPSIVVDLCCDDSENDEIIIDSNSSRKASIAASAKVTENKANAEAKVNYEPTSHERGTIRNNDAKNELLCGSAISSSTLTSHQIQQLEMRQLSLAIAESNRQIKDTQDSEYYESLIKDREKELQKKRKREKQEFLAQQKQKCDKERILLKQRKLIENQRMLLPEPSNESPIVTTIAFRLPSTCKQTRLVRKFARTSSANQLFFFLTNVSDLSKIKRWKLFQVVGGEEISYDSGKTLEDFGLCPRALVIVRDEDC